MVTGTPPISSLTISCDIKIARGNARASPLISTLITGSFSFRYGGESDTSWYLGLSIGGMPSRGGPPDKISSNGTECLEKSVLQPRVRNSGGSSLRSSTDSTTTGLVSSSFGAAVDGAGAGAGDDPAVSLDGAGTLKVTVLSVARLLGEAIKRIHANESVSKIFGFNDSELGS